MTLQKLTRILQQGDCSLELRRPLRDYFGGSTKYTITLHKSLKFDGKVQGMDVTHLYCSRSEDSGRHTSNRDRFDWVELNMEDDLYPSITIKRGTQRLNPFPTLKYDSNNFNLDELDVINKPAFVIPSSTLRTQLVETNSSIRIRILFTAVPFAFIHRDDWDDLSRGITWSETQVSEGESLRLIPYRCTKLLRDRTMALCINALDMEVAVPHKNTLERIKNRFYSNPSIDNAIQPLQHGLGNIEEYDEVDEENDEDVDDESNEDME